MFRASAIRRVLDSTVALRHWIKTAPSVTLTELDHVSLNRVRGLVSTLECEGDSKSWTEG